MFRGFLCNCSHIHSLWLISTREYAAWCVSLIYHMELIIKPKRTQKIMIIFHYMDQWLFINTGQWHVCVFVKDVDQLKLCLNDHEWCVFVFFSPFNLKRETPSFRGLKPMSHLKLTEYGASLLVLKLKWSVLNRHSLMGGLYSFARWVNVIPHEPFVQWVDRANSCTLVDISKANLLVWKYSANRMFHMSCRVLRLCAICLETKAAIHVPH